MSHIWAMRCDKNPGSAHALRAVVGAAPTPFLIEQEEHFGDAPKLATGGRVHSPEKELLRNVFSFIGK